MFSLEPLDLPFYAHQHPKLLFSEGSRPTAPVLQCSSSLAQWACWCSCGIPGDEVRGVLLGNQVKLCHLSKHVSICTIGNPSNFLLSSVLSYSNNPGNCGLLSALPLQNPVVLETTTLSRSLLNRTQALPVPTWSFLLLPLCKPVRPGFCL